MSSTPTNAASGKSRAPGGGNSSSDTFDELTREYNFSAGTLEKLQANNDACVVDIASSDQEIIDKEKRLHFLKSQHAEEELCLRTELECITAQRITELDFHKNNYERSEMTKIRVDVLVQQNAELQNAVAALTDGINAAHQHYSSEMHRLNVHMRDQRRINEEKLKKDIVNMEDSYKENAFNSLKQGTRCEE
jgi:hypothetical protein